MNKLSCDIMKDLIPSYLDEICSDDTKELIDEHICKCNDCKEYVDKMRENFVFDEKVNKKEFDYMKKVKRHYVVKNTLIYLLFVGFIALGTVYIALNYGDVPTYIYYFILPVLSLSSFFIVSGNRGILSKSKIENVLLGVSILLLLYSITLQFLCMNWSKNNVYPFSIPENQSGPFLYYQMLVTAILQILIFVRTMITAFLNATSNNILITTSLTGCSISFAFISVLKRLSSIDFFQTLRNTSLTILLLEGAALILLVILFDKKNHNKM